MTDNTKVALKCQRFLDYFYVCTKKYVLLCRVWWLRSTKMPCGARGDTDLQLEADLHLKGECRAEKLLMEIKTTTCNRKI